MAISLNNAGTLASNFFSWWFGELDAMWQPISGLFRQGPKMLTLDTSDQPWVLRLQKGSRSQEVGKLDSRSSANVGRKTVGTVTRKAKLRKADLTVLLPESRSLRRPLDLPAIDDADLRRALYFEIERQTPFRPEDVYFDYRLLSRRSETKRLTVELITAPRTTVDPILKQANEWGLQPSTVDIVPRNATRGIGVNLIKPEQSASKWSSIRVATAMIFVALLAAVFYVPVAQLGTEDDALAAQVAEEGGKAKQTLAKRAELDETVRAAAFLDERKKNVAGTLAVLNELTKALPDNTWLTNFTQNETDIKISGYSAAASELIALIDAVPLFKNPTFSSPITQDPQKKLERFDISFELGTKSGKR